MRNDAMDAFAFSACCMFRLLLHSMFRLRCHMRSGNVQALPSVRSFSQVSQVKFDPNPMSRNWP